MSQAPTTYRFIDGSERRADELRTIVPELSFELAPLPASYSASAPDPAQRARDKLIALDDDVHLAFAEAADLTTLDGRSLRIDLDSENETRFCRYWRETPVRMHLCVAVRRAPHAPIEIFRATCEGRIADSPAGPHGVGWDRIFVPDGYDRTLAEIGQRPFLVGLRAHVYVELANALGLHAAGAFEVHVTVDAAVDRDGFLDACDAFGVKAVVVDAPGARPMTASIHHGALADVQATAFELARSFDQRLMPVTRVVIEALGDAGVTPITDDDARARPPHERFEYHAKIVLPAAADVAPLAALAERHGARMSAHPRHRYPDGRTARFVTLRVRELGRAAADARFATLLAELASAGYDVVQRAREYTVFDSDGAPARSWDRPVATIS